LPPSSNWIASKFPPAKLPYVRVMNPPLSALNSGSSTLSFGGTNLRPAAASGPSSPSSPTIASFPNSSTRCRTLAQSAVPRMIASGSRPCPWTSISRPPPPLLDDFRSELPDRGVVLLVHRPGGVALVRFLRRAVGVDVPPAEVRGDHVRPLAGPPLQLVGQLQGDHVDVAVERDE
jgi:hypothetical protein